MIAGERKKKKGRVEKDRGFINSGVIPHRPISKWMRGCINQVASRFGGPTGAPRCQTSCSILAVLSPCVNIMILPPLPQLLPDRSVLNCKKKKKAAKAQWNNPPLWSALRHSCVHDIRRSSPASAMLRISRVAAPEEENFLFLERNREGI